MKNKKLYLRIFTVLTVSFYSCDSDPCDEGYTEVTENGSTFCLPDYVAGIEKQTEYGNRFYHNEYGIIAFDNGKWTNPFGENLKNIEHNE
jgi:hypothetical protein